MTAQRDSTAWRASLVRRTAPLVVLVARLPRWVPFVVVLALAAAGGFGPPLLGALALLLLAAAAAVLLLHSWPLLEPRTRAPRALVVAALVALAVLRLT